LAKTVSKDQKQEFLMYKDKPLVRSGSTIYYGNMSDKYIIMMQVLDSDKIGDLEHATKVAVQLQYTDITIKAKDRILKKTEKDGFYNAMDIAAIWLERAMEEEP